MSPTTPDVPIEPWLREILRCPMCHSTLVDTRGPDGAAELACGADAPPSCRMVFPVTDGIPVLLVDEARLPATE